MKTNIFRPKNLFMIFLGNTTMALGIVMFVLPNELMTGGTTGLSLIINHYLHLPISVFVFIFNCIMFLLGALILGFDFALTTLISTFYYPIKSPPKMLDNIRSSVIVESEGIFWKNPSAIG